MNSQFGVLNMQDFSIKRKISNGTFGVVFQAENIHTHQVVALKLIKKQAEQPLFGFQYQVLREISFLREVQSPLIIKILDVFQAQGLKILVFQKQQTDLKEYISSLQQDIIPPALVKKMMFQLISGIVLCHRKKIMHRDLKPSNLLLDHEKNLIIGDFGCARKFGGSSLTCQTYSQPVVTFPYRAPQLLLGTKIYTSAIDMWSIGCIFAEIVTKRILFAGNSEIDQKKGIFRFLGTPNEQTWPGVSNLTDFVNKVQFPIFEPSDLKEVLPLQNLQESGVDLLKKLLILDPKKRISAKDAIQHPYFYQMQCESNS